MAWRKKVNRTLYHGSNEDFGDIALEKSLPIGYLGRGFYLSSGKLEAAFYAIARTVLEGGEPYLYSYCFTGHPKFFNIQNVPIGKVGSDDCDIAYQERSLRTRIRMFEGAEEVSIKSKKAIANLALLQKTNLRESRLWKFYLCAYRIMNFLCSKPLRERLSKMADMQIKNREHISDCYESPILNFMSFKTECGFAASCSSTIGSWDDSI